MKNNVKGFKNPDFRTACDHCSHLTGGLLGRDERDTQWGYECELERAEFYEQGDECPEASPRPEKDYSKEDKL